MKTYVNNDQISRKEKKSFKPLKKSNKTLNALIEKKFQNFVKNKKKKENRGGVITLPKNILSDDESKKIISSLAESVK